MVWPKIANRRRGFCVCSTMSRTQAGLTGATLK
jgi:hypothetical protein